MFDYDLLLLLQLFGKLQLIGEKEKRCHVLNKWPLSKHVSASPWANKRRLAPGVLNWIMCKLCMAQSNFFALLLNYFQFSNHTIVNALILWKMSMDMHRNRNYCGVKHQINHMDSAWWICYLDETM